MKNSYPEVLLLLVIAILVSLPMFATDIYISSLPYLTKAFHTNDYLIKLSLYSYILGYAITTLLSGIYSDIYSKYKIVLGGIVVFTIASLIIPTGDSLASLIIGRFLQGLGGGTGTVIARLILKEQIPNEDKQLKALSLVAASMAISPLIGPYLGAIIAHRFGWQAIFYFLGFSGALLLIPLYSLVKKEYHNTSASRFQLIEIITIYKATLKNPDFIVPTIAIGLACASEFAFIANSSFFYQDVLGFSSVTYSLILSLALSGFLAGSYILNYAIKNMPREQILSLTVKLCTLATITPLLALAYGIKLSGYILIISTIITQAGVGIIVPLTQSTVLNIQSKRSSSVTGLFFFIEFVLMGIIGYVLSLFTDKLLPMLIGISLCWVAIYITEKLLVRRDTTLN